jgi:hypothetical protein
MVLQPHTDQAPDGTADLKDVVWFGRRANVLETDLAARASRS